MRSRTTPWFKGWGSHASSAPFARVPPPPLRRHPVCARVLQSQFCVLSTRAFPVLSDVCAVLRLPFAIAHLLPCFPTSAFPPPCAGYGDGSPPRMLGGGWLNRKR